VKLSSDILIQSIFNGLVSGGIYILIALGLTLVMSIMGIVQLAHGEIYMLGAYVVYYMITLTGANFFVALIVAVIAIGGLGILLERFFFRPFRAHLEGAFIISIGLILFLQNTILMIAGGESRPYHSPFSGSIQILNTTISTERLFVVLIGAVLVLALFLFIHRSKVGKAMLAISQDKEGAAVQGIDIDRVSAIAMFLGCGLAAIAGALVGALFSVTPTMGGFALMKGIAVIILGGLGSITGAVFGGLIIGLIDAVVPVFSTPHIAGLISFGTIILILLFHPQGILGHE
jgi:branched-chain amino acid transport system permease protein